MPDNPQQDRDLKLPAARQNDGRYVTVYDPFIGLRIVERIAEGELLKDICAPGSGMPHRGTFHRWTLTQPELAKAYHTARELSAQAFEEDALGLARDIKGDPDATGTKVRAYEVAMNQFRWSASRRDPGRYGDKATVSVRVPVHITTVLDMNETGSGSTAEHPNIYDLEAKVEVEAPLQEVDTPLLPARRRQGNPGKRILTPRIAMDTSFRRKDRGPDKRTNKGREIARNEEAARDTGTIDEEPV